MAFEEDYHEVMRVIDETLKTIFKGLQGKYHNEVRRRHRQIEPTVDILL